MDRQEQVLIDELDNLMVGGEDTLIDENFSAVALYLLLEEAKYRDLPLQFYVSCCSC